MKVRKLEWDTETCRRGQFQAVENGTIRCGETKEEAVQKVRKVLNAEVAARTEKDARARVAEKLVQDTSLALRNSSPHEADDFTRVEFNLVAKGGNSLSYGFIKGNSYDAVGALQRSLKPTQTFLCDLATKIDRNRTDKPTKTELEAACQRLHSVTITVEKFSGERVRADFGGHSDQPLSKLTESKVPINKLLRTLKDTRGTRR